jgi:hypothetical protein
MRRHALDPVSLVFGFAFTAAGVLFFADQFDQAVRLRWLWPVLLLVLGLGILLDLGTRREQASPEPAEAPLDAQPAAGLAGPDRAAAEPVAAEQAGAEPVAAASAPAEPVAGEPAPAEPVAGEPAEAEPAAAEAEPVAGEPAGAEPGEGDQVEAPAAERTAELGPEGPADRDR